MKNYIQPGIVITVRNSPVAAQSGDLIVIGDLCGVAVTDGEVGDNIPLKTEEVFYLPKVGAENVTVGQRLAYIAADRRLTGDLTLGKIVAVAVEEATNGQTHVAAKLLPTILPAETVVTATVAATTEATDAV